MTQSSDLDLTEVDALPEDEGQPPAPARRKKAAKPRAEPRPVLVRLFGLSPWGAFKLIVLCILVGFFVLASQFDPRDPDVDMGSMIASMARSAMEAAGWSVRNFWKPALAGAGLVLPVWVLWRLVSLPFRK